MQEDKQCTFSPETGTAAHVLAASEQPHARESFLEKVERLATLDKQKQDACREATAQHYYAQFSFQPQINARSKRIASVSFTVSLCSLVASLVLGIYMGEWVGGWVLGTTEGDRGV